jgi:hypothetical protein
MPPLASPVRLALVASVLMFGLGCGGSEDPPALDEYFVATPYGNPACDAIDGRLTGEREMHLFVHGGLSELLPVTQGLASYYHRYSLSFVTLADPEKTAMSYALDTDLNALMRQLVAAFPGVDLNDEQALMADPVLWNDVQRFIVNYIMRPMIEFASANAAGQGVTNLVLIPYIERPGGMKLGDPGTTLAGLSVSPALLAEFARMMTEDGAIWQGVNLPDGFTPMMVLGGNVLAQVDGVAPVLRDLVTAHEFGHSSALTHSTVARNLMYPNVMPGRDDCSDGLTDAQLDTMRATLGLGTLASGALLAAGAEVARPETGAGALARFRAAFRPTHLRAAFAGDVAPLGALLRRLFHDDPDARAAVAPAR